MKKILAILILISSYSRAQQPLYLKDAINIALKNSLDIQLSKNNVEANTIYNNYGIAGGLPLITGTANDIEQLTNINQKLSNGTVIKRYGATANNLTSGVTASILLYNGMRVVTTKKRLEELQQQSEQLLNAQIQNIIAAMMTNYYDVVRQQSYLKTLEQSIEVSKQRLNIVQIQQSVGLANNADLFQTQLDLNALIQARESQQLIIDQAKTNLLTLLTLKADSAISISDTIIVERNISLENILSNLHQSPEVHAVEEQIRINELIEKETAAQRYPSVSFNSGYNFNLSKSSGGFNLYNENYGPFIGLYLSVPIYNGSVYKRQQHVAEINTQSAVIQKDILVRDNTSSAVKSYQSYQNALQQLETEKQNYSLAQQLLDLVLQRFELRVATIVDVEIAQQTFQDAGYRLVNLSFAAKAAEIEMKRLTNQLSF